MTWSSRPGAACAPPSEPADAVSLSGAAHPSAPPRGADVLAPTVAAAAGPVVGAGLLAGLKTGFVNGYMSPSEVYQWAQDLSRRYPDLVELVERPYQTDGYDGKKSELRGPAPLYYLRIGPRSDPERDQKVGVLNFAAPHAREWCQPIGMVELTEQLLANYDPTSSQPAVAANTALVQSLDLYVIPVTNPDGTNYSMFDESMWRKNRSPEAGGVGVDINRNYPHLWKSSSDVDSEVYPGSAPLSEPETRHVVELVEERPNIRFLCDWHSKGEEVRRPWGVSEADRPIYDAMHSRLAGAIKSVRGREYATVTSQVVNGASDDYFYHHKGVFSTIVEDAREFQPAIPEALQVSREIAAGARELLHFALDYSRHHGLEATRPPGLSQMPPPPSED